MNQLLRNSETLKFRIGISGSYWDKKPAYSVSVDGVEQASYVIAADTGVVEYAEFTLAVLEDSPHLLEIKLLNKLTMMWCNLKTRLKSSKICC